MINKSKAKSSGQKRAVSQKIRVASKELTSDKLYRRLYAHPIMVEDLIKTFVKERFVEKIDFSTLKELKTKFVTDKYGFRESDTMYELKIKGEVIYFYILLEFQSTVDKFMPVRMLTYIMLFYQDWLQKQVEYRRKKKEKEKGGILEETDIEAIYETIQLPAVFPILLYSGNREWKTPSELKELIAVRYKALEKYVPNFRYYKIIEREFSNTSLEELKSINAAMFRLDKAGENDLGECALRLTKLLKKEANMELQQDFKLWLNQLIRGYEIKEKDIQKIVKAFEEGNMTIFEYNRKKEREEREKEREECEKLLKKEYEEREKEREELFKKEREKEREEIVLGLLEDGVDIKIIAKRTGFSETKIKSLFKKITKKAA